MTLRPVQPGMLPDERVAMYEHYRRAGGVITCNSNRNGTFCGRSAAIMNDGTEVAHPEDFLPILPPDGETARAAMRATADRRRRWLWGALGFVGFAAGSVVGLTSVPDNSHPGEGVAGGLIAAGFAAVMVAVVYGLKEQREKVYVFDHYTSDLAEELHLCANGLALVPCETSRPGPDVDPNLGSLRPQ